MNVLKILVGDLDTNCYIVGNDEEVFIIDPGGDAEKIENIVRERKVSAILLTHGHIDHILAVPLLKEKYKAPVGIHEEGLKILSNPQINLSSFMGKNFSITDVDFTLQDGEEKELNGFKVKYIYTPGHTSDSGCFLIDNKLFSGDTLFYMSVGRTDLPTGDAETLSRSIKEKLYVLPDETEVFPGHMRNTTIGFEKENNTFVTI